MRKLPKNFSELNYLFQKTQYGLFFLRGLFRLLLLKRGSSLSLIGKNIKMISISKIKLGRLSVLCSNGYIDASSYKGVTISDFSTIREYFWIQCRSGLNELGEGLFIDKSTYIGPFAKIGISGFVKIGKNCQIGARFSVNAESHEFYNGSYTSGQTSRKGITIEDDVWIGDNVTILDGVTIGAKSVIGANSLVNKDIPSNTVAFGIPCKPKNT